MKKDCQDFNFETHLNSAHYEAPNRWSVSYSGITLDPKNFVFGFSKTSLVKTPFLFDYILLNGFKSYSRLFLKRKKESWPQIKWEPFFGLSDKNNSWMLDHKKKCLLWSVGYYPELWAKTDVLTAITRQGKPPVRGGVNLFFPSTLSSLAKRSRGIRVAIYKLKIVTVPSPTPQVCISDSFILLSPCRLQLLRLHIATRYTACRGGKMCVMASCCAVQWAIAALCYVRPRLSSLFSADLLHLDGLCRHSRSIIGTQSCIHINSKLTDLRVATLPRVTHSTISIR